MKTAEALKEMMEKYNESRKLWIEKFGSADGFDSWFTSQVLPKAETC